MYLFPFILVSYSYFHSWKLLITKKSDLFTHTNNPLLFLEQTVFLYKLFFCDEISFFGQTAIFSVVNLLDYLFHWFLLFISWKCTFWKKKTSIFCQVRFNFAELYLAYVFVYLASIVRILSFSFSPIFSRSFLNTFLLLRKRAAIRKVIGTLVCE